MAEVATVHRRWQQHGGGNGSTAEALWQRRWQCGSRVGQTAVAISDHGFNVFVVTQQSSAICKHKRAEAGIFEIMLKQPEIYLTFCNIDWTFSNLDLSHYYLRMLQNTKSG